MNRFEQPRTALAAILASLALALAAFAPAAPAALRHFDGTVLSKDASTHTFRVLTQNGARLRVKVDAKTRFERIGGFAGLHRGLAVQVEAAKTGGGLLAKKVESRTGGRGGADDGPNHP